jgi:hypothetical protein
MMKIKPSMCPVCHTEHDGASDEFGKTEHLPLPGDATMCCDCGSFSVFDADLIRRTPTAAEQAALNADARVRLSRVAFAIWKKQQQHH